MVIAQSILVLPVIAALSRQLVADSLREGGDQLALDGRRAADAAPCCMLVHERWSVVTVLLTAFGRAVSEVGAVMIVGGNIDGVTRVITTTIALETSKGDLPLALALGLVLLVVVGVINAAVALEPGREAADARAARDERGRAAAEPGPASRCASAAFDALKRRRPAGPARRVRRPGRRQRRRQDHAAARAARPRCRTAARAACGGGGVSQAMVFQRPFMLRSRC